MRIHVGMHLAALSSWSAALPPLCPLSPGAWLSTRTRLTDRTSWSCRREKGSVCSARTRTGGCGACPSSPAGSASSPATTSLPSSGLGFPTGKKNPCTGEGVAQRAWDLLVSTEHPWRGTPPELGRAGIPPQVGWRPAALTLLFQQEIQSFRVEDAFPVHLMDAVDLVAVVPRELVGAGPEAEPGAAASAAARARPCPCPRQGTGPAAPRPRQLQEE